VANFREELLRQTYPRIADLQEQVQLTYWSEHHLVPQDLLEILPFGRLFSAQSFYRYIDFQLIDLLNAARRCIAYWQLSGAHNFDQSPATQISLFYDETFLWHYFVPSHRPEITTQIQAGHRVRFLSRFFVSETKVEVEFNEIRLQTNPSGEFNPDNLYQNRLQRRANPYVSLERPRLEHQSSHPTYHSHRSLFLLHPPHHTAKYPGKRHQIPGTFPAYPLGTRSSLARFILSRQRGQYFTPHSGWYPSIQSPKHT